VQHEVPERARSVQQVLYAYADGIDGGWVDIEDAAARAAQIQGWLDGYQGVEFSGDVNCAMRDA
jgi:hypothetical protein